MGTRGYGIESMCHQKLGAAKSSLGPRMESLSLGPGNTVLSLLGYINYFTGYIYNIRLLSFFD